MVIRFPERITVDANGDGVYTADLDDCTMLTLVPGSRCVLERESEQHGWTVAELAGGAQLVEPARVEQLDEYLDTPGSWAWRGARYRRELTKLTKGPAAGGAP